MILKMSDLTVDAAFFFGRIAAMTTQHFAELSMACQNSLTILQGRLDHSAPVHEDALEAELLLELAGGGVQPLPDPTHVQDTAAMQHHTGKRQSCCVKCKSSVHHCPCSLVTSLKNLISVHAW